MFAWLKKYFIAHKGNDHRPHALRGSSVRMIVFIIILLEIGAFLVPTLALLDLTGGAALVLPGVMSELTNEEREAQNLSILAVNPILNHAAEMKATDMAAKSYFAHTSPEGKTPWYWLEQAGYSYQYAGENLAINFGDSKDVTSAWMASPSHKANIVKENYTEIGTGVATGIYQGKETVFVAQVYANPLPKAPKQVRPVKTETDVKEVPNISVAPEPTNVLGAETVPETIKPAQSPTFWHKLFASPRNTTNIILYVIFGIIALILLLYVFMKIENLHLGLLTNGLITLAVIGAIFIANYYVTHRDMVVTQSLDYSNENK